MPYEPILTPPDRFPSPLQRALASLGQLGRSLVRELQLTVLPAVAIAVLINLFLAQGTHVHGQSMEPNLHPHQRLIVEKLSYRIHAPRRGDIVVVKVQGFEVPLIKRVIGLPGEKVEIRDNRVFVNGLSLQESYLSEAIQPDYGPTIVDPGTVFVLGDNRAASNDSRYFGPVPIEGIVGRAWLSYWPFAELGLVE
jgi:signal peptidase I